MAAMPDPTTSTSAMSTQSSRSNLAEQLQITDSKELFEKFDTDDSGGISEEEWRAFFGKRVDGLPAWEELVSKLRDKGLDDLDFESFQAILPKIREILRAEVVEGPISPKNRFQRAESGLDKYIASLHQALSRGDSGIKSMDTLADFHLEPLSKDELHKQSIMKKFLSQIEKVVDDSNKSCVKDQLIQLGLDDDLPKEIPIIYKSYRLTQMRFLHFAVYYCKSLWNTTETLKFLLEQKADVHAEGAYQGFGKAHCTVRPIHLAAANPRGGIEELRLLLKHRAEVNARVTHNGEPHSTPLLDATFMNEADAQGERIVFLLDKKADPNLADKKTCQALHLVAQQGSDPELLIKVVPAMVRGGADLGAKIKATEDNKMFNKQLVGKTPLQIAADLQSSPSFPKEMLYLLAQSSWDSESAHKKLETDLFEEVRMMATVNRNAASQFTQSIKNKTNPNHNTALRKLRAEALEKSGHAIKKLSEIFSLAPLAGADILDMLVDTPLVEVKQQHPLPTCVDLGWLWFKVPMRCAYRDDEKDGKPAWLFANRGAGEWPEWHNSFKQEQMGRDSVYNVQTRVLWLPNALNIQLFTALSGQGSWNIEVFGQLAISGMIACVWDNLVWTVYCWRMMKEILMILVLLCWNARFLSSGMWILLLSSLGFEGIGLLGQTRACFDLGLLGPIFTRACFKLGLRAPCTPDTPGTLGTPGTPSTPGTPGKSGTPFLISKMEAGATLMLIPLVIIRPETGVEWVEAELHDRICDMLLSFNVAFRFLKLVYGLRAFQETGRTILSIQQSLIARNVRQMLVVAFLFFVGSLLVFLTVRGRERFSQVVLAVFRVMVLTDQEGLSTLTALQGGDMHGIYTGVMSYAITPFYTICLLTLVTAVYSNEYANIDPRASLLFEKSRAKICAQFMLHAHGLKSILPGKRPHSMQAAGAILVLCLGVLFLLKDENIWTFLLGVITASCLVYMKIYWYFDLVQTRWDLPGVTGNSISEDESAGGQTKSRFLWICHREDFDPTNWRDNESAKEKQIEEIEGRLNKLSQEAQTIRHTTKSQMDKIELTLKRVLENQDRMLKMCEKIEQAS